MPLEKTHKRQAKNYDCIKNFNTKFKNFVLDILFFVIILQDELRKKVNIGICGNAGP